MPSGVKTARRHRSKLIGCESACVVAWIRRAEGLTRPTSAVCHEPQRRLQIELGRSVFRIERQRPLQPVGFAGFQRPPHLRHRSPNRDGRRARPARV